MAQSLLSTCDCFHPPAIAPLHHFDRFPTPSIAPIHRDKAPSDSSEPRQPSSLAIRLGTPETRPALTRATGATGKARVRRPETNFGPSRRAGLMPVGSPTSDNHGDQKQGRTRRP